MNDLISIGQRAKKASGILNRLSQADKNKGLYAASEALWQQRDEILSANAVDVQKAAAAGISDALIDRLKLSEERIRGMSDGLMQVAGLKDPVGELLSMENRPNGLKIMKQRVPIGVIGIIYESRPNVTSDAFGLCFKAGNAVILRGGSDAIHSNKAITDVLRKAVGSVCISDGREGKLPEDALQLIEDTKRETAAEMMRLNAYIDVLIPRGGSGLISAVVNNSTIPVIETGLGNCHIFVDESADLDMALSIILNAKTQRPGVCNACESLVIHAALAERFIPVLCKSLQEHQVEIRGDEKAAAICPSIAPASEEDYYREYLDKIISIKIVPDIGAAISHINHYNTKHSEAIITENYQNALRFTNEIDAAAVYVNASTRFTDGEEFGYGAEIGISTQKLHARGPMGLNELTSSKYVIFGTGQVR